MTSIVVEVLKNDGELWGTRWDIDAPLTLKYIDTNHKETDIRLLIALMKYKRITQLQIVNPTKESRL